MLNHPTGWLKQRSTQKHQQPYNFSKKVKIPNRLQELLSSTPGLEGAVKLSISQFEPWIRHSNLPFFPEYTDHGIDHIEAVLRTASSLIRDEAWGALTSGDAATLIVGVLLHDCAMHLTENGFIHLLSASRQGMQVEGMGDRSWTVLWEDFLGEASRFDGRKLVELFGTTNPTRRPPLAVNEMTRLCSQLITRWGC